MLNSQSTTLHKLLRAEPCLHAELPAITGWGASATYAALAELHRQGLATWAHGAGPCQRLVYAGAPSRHHQRPTTS